MSNSETTYKVSGMTCGGCERSVVRALSRAVPGATVSASHAEGTVTVSGEHDAKAVSQAVEGAGFTFEG